MSGPIVVRPGVVIGDSEIRWRFSRSSGPGGQSVNTSDSRVELIFDVVASRSLSPTLKARAVARLGDRLIEGVLVIAASEERSQLRNRELACRRLANILDIATAPPPRTRRATRPTRAAMDRRIAQKKRRGQIKRLRGARDD